MSFNPTYKTHNISKSCLGLSNCSLAQKSVQHQFCVFCYNQKGRDLQRSATRQRNTEWGCGWESTFLIFLLSWEHCPVSAVVHLSKQT